MNVKAADLSAMLAPLPHRYPLLLVDRLMEHEPGVLARGLKNVTVNDPWFQGHFPGYPVMPGVLVIEALAQLSALLAHDRGLALDLSGISGARFKRQVSPGDRLTLETRMGTIVDDSGSFDVQAAVDGELAAEAKLLVMFTPLVPGTR